MQYGFNVKQTFLLSNRYVNVTFTKENILEINETK